MSLYLSAIKDTVLGIFVIIFLLSTQAAIMGRGIPPLCRPPAAAAAWGLRLPGETQLRQRHTTLRNAALLYVGQSVNQLRQVENERLGAQV